MGRFGIVATFLIPLSLQAANPAPAKVANCDDAFNTEESFEALSPQKIQTLLKKIPHHYLPDEPEKLSKRDLLFLHNELLERLFAMNYPPESYNNAGNYTHTTILNSLRNTREHLANKGFDFTKSDEMLSSKQHKKIKEIANIWGEEILKDAFMKSSYREAASNLLPFLKDWDAEKKEKLIKALGPLDYKSNLNGLPEKTVEEIRVQRIKNLLGDKNIPEPKAFAVLTSYSEHQLYIVGGRGLSHVEFDSEPLSGGERDFYLALPLASFSFSPDGPTRELPFHFNNGGQKFEGVVKIKQADPKKKISFRNPNYESMKADGSFTGLIHINMDAEFNGELAENYRDYFEDAGFKVSDPVSETNTKDFVLKKIASGEVDYILKEDNGGAGDMFSAVNSTKIWTLTKNSPAGSKEKVYLIAPSGPLGFTTINHQDLKQALVERKTNPHDPDLIFINTTCNSLDLACNLVAQVKEPALLTVAPNSIAETFMNYEGYPIYEILEGIRDGKKWMDIKKASGKAHKDDPEYDAEENQYVFPSQKVYRDYTAQNLEDSYEFEVELKKVKKAKAPAAEANLIPPQ